MSGLAQSKKLPLRTPTGLFDRLALLFLAFAFFVSPAVAHDIPSDITVRAYVKPQGQTLRVLLHLPLRAVQDVEFPRIERDFVDLSKIQPSLRDAANSALVNNLSIYEEDTLLTAPTIVATQMSLDSDRSFDSYDTAVGHITGAPLAPETTLFWEQGVLDVILEYRIKSDASRFAVHAAFDRFSLKTVTALQFLPPGGTPRVYELQGDAGLVQLDPRWFQAAARFVADGFHHILEGTDHLLFLLCLVIPFRRARTIIPIVTAFTVAHSITLIASAFGYAPDVGWFQPLIETLIALSIVYMALENIVAPQVQRRWFVTFLFGLVHGFGFSFVLQHTLQFAGSHLLTSLVSFNVGVELGQLLVLALMIPVLEVLFRYVVAERIGTIIISAFVAHTAWHWMGERFDVLAQFPWPGLTVAGLAEAFRWAFFLVAMMALAWGAGLLWQRYVASQDRKSGAFEG